MIELDNLLSGGTTTYPTSNSPTVSTADQDKRCTQCHADHNVFSQEINAASTGRQNVLRATINTAPIPGQAPGSSSSTGAPGYYQNK